MYNVSYLHIYAVGAEKKEKIKKKNKKTKNKKNKIKRNNKKYTP